jgi:hypothetical protein
MERQAGGHVQVWVNGYGAGAGAGSRLVMTLSFDLGGASE